MEFGAEQSVEILEDLKDYLGSFIFVEDGCHTGSFMLTRLLLHALRSIGDGFTEVVLVSTAYPLEHYEALLRRNSLDVRIESLAKRVTMLFLVPDGSLTEQTSIVGKEERARVAAANAYYPCRHCEWKELNSFILNKLNGAQPNHPSVLFVDDLTLLESLAPSRQQARKLLFSILHNLKHSDLANSGIGTFVTASPVEVCPDDPIALEEDEEPSITELARHHANVLISTLPLSSGFSNEVHGLIRYTACRSGQVLRENFAYKVQNPHHVSFIELKTDG